MYLKMPLVGKCLAKSSIMWLLLCFLIVPFSRADLMNEKWIELTSNNFVVYSTLDEEKSREILYNLEAFRVATLALTNIANTTSKVPTKIYIIKKSQLPDLNVSRRIGGFIQPDVQSNTILVAHSPSFDGSTIIYHEYVHFLLRNHSSQRYPRWYDEGFAEYLASVKNTKEHFQLGQFAEHRAPSFRHGSWLNLRSVINPIRMDKWSASKQSQFYANAWLLVHFLNNHPDFKSNLPVYLAKYLQLKNEGIGNVEAFEQAFSVKTSRLNAMLKKYVRRGQFTAKQYDKKRLLAGVNVSASPMSKPKAALKLAEFRGAREPGLARAWLQEAKKDDGNKVRVDLLSNKIEIARLSQQKLSSKESLQNVDFSLDLEEFENLVLQANNIVSYLVMTKNKDESLIASARELLVKAWKQNKEAPVIYYLYGRLFLLEGQESGKAVDMFAEAEYFLPANLEIRLYLARALAWNNEIEQAFSMAKSVANWTHEGSWYYKQASSLMANVKPETDEASTPAK